MVVDLGESGIDADFLRDVSSAMPPGKVAVLAEIQETWETPVDTRLRPLGAVVFRRLRSEVVEDQLAREAAALRAERQRLREDFAQASAEARAAMQAQLDAVDRQLEAIREQTTARADQAKRELEAKVDRMRERMKQANDREKARIEKRMAEAKADYAVRSAKLEQAGKLVRDALAP
jgi:exonuclease VII large subunit